MAWPIRWPFGRHADRDRASTGDPLVARDAAASPASPTGASGHPTRPTGEWANLPPLRPSADGAIASAPTTAFVRDIAAGLKPPLALAPLGHDRTADGPGGLVSAAAPLVARRTAIDAAADPVASTGRLAGALRRLRVQRLPVRSAAAVPDDDAEPGAGETPPGSAEHGEQSPLPAIQLRRVAAIAGSSASANPETPPASLVHAATSLPRVDGRIGPAPSALAQRVPTVTSLAPESDGAPASLPSRSADKPASAATPATTSLRVATPASAAPTSSVQRVDAGSVVPFPDTRSGRLSVGQVRRLGLGTPFAGPRPAADAREPGDTARGPAAPVQRVEPSTPSAPQAGPDDVAELAVSRSATVPGDPVVAATDSRAPQNTASDLRASGQPAQVDAAVMPPLHRPSTRPTPGPMSGPPTTGIDAPLSVAPRIGVVGVQRDHADLPLAPLSDDVPRGAFGVGPVVHGDAPVVIARAIAPHHASPAPSAERSLVGLREPLVHRQSGVALQRATAAAPADEGGRPSPASFTGSAGVGFAEGGFAEGASTGSAAGMSALQARGPAEGPRFVARVSAGQGPAAPVRRSVQRDAPRVETPSRHAVTSMASSDSATTTTAAAGYHPTAAGAPIAPIWPIEIDLPPLGGIGPDPAVQRAPAADAGPAASSTGGAAGSAGAAAAVARGDSASAGASRVPTGDRELDELALHLYDRIRSRLRRELLVDRERAGVLSDLG